MAGEVESCTRCATRKIVFSILLARIDYEILTFTSAVKDRSGKFLQAQGGTLFLDEIGDMSLSAQAKVLRALQEKKITPVGSNKPIDVDVRVLAATNKDLRAEIKEKKFREDLYHRLGVILIHVPGLNQRLEDIPLLVDHFNQTISAEYGNKPKIFEKEALNQLQQYDDRALPTQLQLQHLL